jgi:hypothetical protein
MVAKSGARLSKSHRGSVPSRFKELSYSEKHEIVSIFTAGNFRTSITKCTIQHKGEKKKIKVFLSRQFCASLTYNHLKFVHNFVVFGFGHNKLRGD